MFTGSFMNDNRDILSLFHPLLARWFREEVGRPTRVQSLAWPLIARGGHVLVSAPTGSGKTLTAFLHALDRFAKGELPLEQTSVLYVSPLKALNNDVRKNLIQPLARLRSVFSSQGLDFPDIRVLTRSGDTSQSRRRKMLRHPPEILITTPESLNLLLSSRGGRSILAGLKTVILDEIHAVYGNKRGTHLITAVERLTDLAGEFQRIALSATIRPLEGVAGFVGGFALSGSPEDPVFTPRPVSLVESQEEKEYRLQIRFPEEIRDREPALSLWEVLSVPFREIIAVNRSTLFFVKGRRMAEKITRMINQDLEQPLAYAHHGSLSRELRLEVEGKLKNGELKAIVATSSLELGIDIGELDQVVLIQSPFSISSAIQRVGRAGHRVGQASKGILFPTHALDLVEAAVLSRAIQDRDIEEAAPVRAPLDVLAQVLVSMAGAHAWDLDLLYARIRTAWPYQELSRDIFDLVINMLAGRYAETRIRELRPRLSVDRLDNTVAARKGALLALYSSGGTIPDRGYFNLRHQETGARIGELDEEFVWEAKLGQVLTLGAQNWRIRKITPSDVLVLPADPRALAAPFWRAEEFNRDFHFSEKIGLFLEQAQERLEDRDYPDELGREHGLDRSSALALVEFLKNQQEAAHAPLPHRHHVLVEHVAAGPGGGPGSQIIIHTFWGGRVNRPLGLALAAAWEERYGARPEIFAGNDCLALVLAQGEEAGEVLSLVKSSTVEELLRKRLEGSGFFGARFREAAGRALLLSRPRFGERMPLWLSRLKSKKLMDAVRSYSDFPLLLEAWRTCLQDEFDLQSLTRLLAELESGLISWTDTDTAQPSPLARAVAFTQINDYMYRGDEPASGRAFGLSQDLLAQVVHTPDLRPAVDPDLAAGFQKKAQRLHPGYAPSDARDLVDWVKERLAIPENEWADLLTAVERDHGLDRAGLLAEAGSKLVRIFPARTAQPLVVALENLGRVVLALQGDGEEAGVMPLAQGTALPRMARPQENEAEPGELLPWFLREWLRFYGPVSTEFIPRTLGLPPGRLGPTLEELLQEGRIIAGELLRGGGQEDLCDAENFEILLRLTRAGAAPAFEPLDLERFSLFLASFQGLTRRARDEERLLDRVEQLACLPLKAAAWEEEVLPARVENYSPAWLDRLFQEHGLCWKGADRERAALCFPADLDLLQDNGAGEAEEERVTGLFPDPNAKYDFSTLLRVSGLPPGRLSQELWRAAWQGRAANDTFAALRRGIMNRFRPPKEAAQPLRSTSGRRRAGRAAFSRWKSSLPAQGNWFLLSEPEEADLVGEEERNRDRVRLLLDRYGVLFRELLLREEAPLRWAALFRTLRLMELSGEVLAGYFFKGIPGPQFASPRAFRELSQTLPEDAVYWISATDPASLCGLTLEGLKGSLPRRVETTHLVFRGSVPVFTSERRGKVLTIGLEPDDPDLPVCLAPLRHLLSRRFRPLIRIKVERINGQHAARSPYLDVFRTCFEVSVDFKEVVLWKDLQDKG